MPFLSSMVSARPPLFRPSDLARWSGGAWSREPEGLLRGFSIDSRTLEPGSCFIALRTDRADGHTYLAKAASRGAVAALVQEDAPSLAVPDIPRLVVPDTRAALTALARGYRAAFSCPMVAVTGSVGKTTVKELLAAMLSAVGTTARSLGNWNNDLGLPLSLLAATPDACYGVFELGMNHPGELDPLCDILRPSLAVVTCIGPVHIEHFPDEAAIAHEKAAVYRGLNGSGIAVLPADDTYAPLLREAAQGNRIIEVSSRNDADYVCRRSDAPSGLFTIHERETGETVTLKASLPGAYFAADATLAAALARALGVPWAAIDVAVRTYQPLTQRWNVRIVQGVRVINDAYNANPVSLRAAVEAFREVPVQGRRWLVLGGMLELGADEERIHRDAGAYLAQYSDLALIAVGPRGCWLAEGAVRAGMPISRVVTAEDHRAAAVALKAGLGGHDAVLFKGSRGERVEEVLAIWEAMLDAATSNTKG